MTAISVSERLSISIILDGTELDLTIFRINFLQILTGTNVYLPYGQLHLVDLTGYFQNNPVGDNQTIKIILTTKDDNNKSNTVLYKMRVFKPDIVKQAGTSMYRFLLTYDAPRYLHESSSSSLGKGTSATALGNISAACGLTFSSNVSTSDSQVWLGNFDRYCISANSICDAGYVDSKSCMMLGVTETGTMKYIDVSKLNYTSVKYSFSNVTHSSNIVYPIVGKVNLITRSGYNNALSGYKAATVAQTPLVYNSSAYSIHTSVSATSPTSTIAYNTNIAKAIKGGKVYFAPINCGNVHNNYESALHQNRRLRSLYGVIFELSTVYTTSLQILDTVELSFYDKQGSERIINKSVSGGYLIIDKGIFVTASGTYYEKFRLARQGNNSLPNSQGS